MSAETEKAIIISYEEQGHQNNKQLLPFQLPCPRLHSLSPDSVSPPSDQVFLQAAAIFQQLRREKPASHQLLQYEKKTDTLPISSGDKAAEQQAYQLAFNTLKYQELLETMITDSCFHTSLHIYGDLLPLAMVMLFDFQQRKFRLRQCPAEGEQEAVPEVRDLEKSLKRWKTKLAASLACFRIKHNLRSVSCVLSNSIRVKEHRAKSLPLYAWVNTLNTSLDEVCELLHGANMSEVKQVVDLTDSTFSKDPLCPDTLIFSQNLCVPLQSSSLTNTHVLNIQDRSVCVAVSVLQPLLFEKGDVLVAGSFSALTLAHIAVAAAARSGQVLVCGADHTSLQNEEMKALLSKMDIKNVKVLPEAFCSLNESNATVERLKVIIVLPQCSSSALNDPVATMYSEHGDWNVLPDLSHGSVSKSKIFSLTTQQSRLLAHSLTFSKVQTVVYCTRSVFPEENEQLVRRVLEQAHTHPKLLPFRENGPIFPDDATSGDKTDSKFFRLQPSEFTNGCFIARLSRQADPTKVETVQDVLARAIAKGLLYGIISEPSKTGKKSKSKKKQAASIKPSSPSSQEESEGEEAVDGREGEESEVGRKDVKTEKKKKRKTKRNQKQTKGDSTGLKHQTKGQKKKAKRKVNQSQQTNSKPKRIPRLTLAMMSAEKPSRHLSPITALAHRISGKPLKRLQEGSSSVPEKHLSHNNTPPSSPQTASDRQNIRPEGAEKTLEEEEGVLPGNIRKPQAKLKAADRILPPISSSPISEGSVGGCRESLNNIPPIGSPSSVALHE
ncbi:PREDICTED: putative methyltransferase NSUN7 isoform X2 [Cyprinodon variegatus]|uniref:putative methyltransferase NSUN7 isoform X2 n=1 Tax=Cyprinodon variegatus TaxID=28743 RepID=UPI000742844A|nr:PREDICTED: putative methyltransferase NSUN7 isoform X2 [Cyprinodon variegatus]